MNSLPRTLLVPALAAIFAVPAWAEQAPSAWNASPVQSATGGPAEWRIDPSLEGRLRTELVRMDALAADSVTVRLRPGVLISGPDGLSLLAEGEGTVALGTAYNAFPFPSASSQRRPQYAVVADPQTIELNRLQVQYRLPQFTVTLGRQRMVMDDARLVGNAGWRQNEQTFDALRTEAKVGPVSLDLAHAISQRTIFGSDAGERTAYDGGFTFLNVGVPIGPVKAKAFAYLLDYDAGEQAGPQAVPLADATTLGVRVAASVKPSSATRLDLSAIWASQSSWADNPANYRTTYLFAEASLAVAKFTLSAGVERLGSDGVHAFQRPTANQPRFEQYLITPAKGLSDAYVGVAYRFTGVPIIDTLVASVIAHRFAATAIEQSYGNGVEASVAFRLGGANVLLKMTDFDGTVSGSSWRRVWIQADFAL